MSLGGGGGGREGEEGVLLNKMNTKYSNKHNTGEDWRFAVTNSLYIQVGALLNEIVAF